MTKLIKGDEVIIIAGKDKGKRGAVQVRVDEDHVIVKALTSSRSMFVLTR
jgi:large subunit ribosomal protein L24